MPKFEFFRGSLFLCLKIGHNRLCMGASSNPSFRLKPKSQIWEVSFRENKTLKKRSKNRNFDFFLRTIKLFVEKNAAAAYAWELFVTFSIRRIRNLRFVNVVFDKIQKNSENSLKIKNLSFLSAINFFVKKSA